MMLDALSTDLEHVLLVNSHTISKMDYVRLMGVVPTTQDPALLVLLLINS